MANKHSLWLRAGVAPILGVRALFAFGLLVLDRVCGWFGFQPYMTDLLDDIKATQRGIEEECAKGKKLRDETLATQRDTIAFKDASIAELTETVRLQRELIAVLKTALKATDVA